MTRPSSTPKAVREALCAAQVALVKRMAQGFDADTVPTHVDQLAILINRIDEFRPLGPDGKHGDRHTSFCGCDGRLLPWAIVLFPEGHRGNRSSAGDGGIPECGFEWDGGFSCALVEGHLAPWHEDACGVRYYEDESAERETEQGQETERERFQGLLSYIWLHVNDRFVMGKLTTEQREMWADAIEACSDPNEPIVYERWWRDDYRGGKS